MEVSVARFRMQQSVRRVQMNIHRRDESSGPTSRPREGIRSPRGFESSIRSIHAEETSTCLPWSSRDLDNFQKDSSLRQWTGITIVTNISRRMNNRR